MTARLSHLDALRGLAAVVVAVFHFMRAFTPEVLGPSWINRSPFSALWNGNFAVEVFFALSGYLFLWKFLGRPAHEAALALPKRYLRLTLPALGACLVAWVIHSLGGFANLQAAALIGSDWLARWYRFAPSADLAIREPLWDMYMAFDPWRSYDANLWTIRYELFVVWGVIAAACLMGRLPAWARWLLGIGLAALAWDTYAFGFALGALVALARRSGMRDVPLPAALAMIAAGLWGGALGKNFEAPLHLLWPAAAALLVAGIDSAAACRTSLDRPWLRQVGSLSFGMYLMHFITANSAAAIALAKTGSILATLAAYAVTTIVAAIAFRDLLDRPSQALLARIFSRNSAAPPPAR